MTKEGAQGLPNSNPESMAFVEWLFEKAAFIADAGVWPYRPRAMRLSACRVAQAPPAGRDSRPLGRTLEADDGKRSSSVEAKGVFPVQRRPRRLRRLR